MGFPDPRLQPQSRQLHPLLDAFLKGMRREDDPQKRSYPVNVRILRKLRDARRDGAFREMDDHTIDLLIVGFFWLLRPCEYLDTQCVESRTQAFRLKHIILVLDGKVYNASRTSLNDLMTKIVTSASLEFDDQKNAVRGETIGHKATSDPIFCPAKALQRIALRHVLHASTPFGDREKPICQHFNPAPRRRQWCGIKPSHATTVLRAAASLVEHETNIPAKLITVRSLRPGGATALLCAGVDSDTIKLLGRWKSDAMFRYLRVQADAQGKHHSQLMLDNGSFTFSPGACAAAGLPREAPPGSAAILAEPT